MEYAAVIWNVEQLVAVGSDRVSKLKPAHAIDDMLVVFCFGMIQKQATEEAECTINV